MHFRFGYEMSSAAGRLIINYLKNKITETEMSLLPLR